MMVLWDISDTWLLQYRHWSKVILRFLTVMKWNRDVVVKKLEWKDRKRDTFKDHQHRGDMGEYHVTEKEEMKGLYLGWPLPVNDWIRKNETILKCNRTRTNYGVQIEESHNQQCQMFSKNQTGLRLWFSIGQLRFAYL